MMEIEGRKNMVGAIRKRDILAHPFVTVRCFGWYVFLRAVIAGRRETFLSIVARIEIFQPPPPRVLRTIERCVALELRAKNAYEVLARRFSQHAAAGEFFGNLAVQEQEHADLLQLCRAAARHDQWTEEYLDSWQDAMPGLERRMEEAERSLDTQCTLADALRFVIAVESSEINQAYQGVVSATRAEFVMKLRAFQEATSTHLAYISRGIETLDPTLRSDCEELLDARHACAGSGAAQVQEPA